VLAGYKEFLWDIVFDRLKKFIPENIDVCIISSGLYSNRLFEISKNNKWSYLSLKQNSIPRALNVAINLFPSAQYIFKFDEDIFITENLFEKLLDCYNYCSEKGNYLPAFVAPLLPVNGYCYLRLLEILSLKEEFEKQFGVIKHTKSISFTSEITQYFWAKRENGGHFPHIDVLNKFLNQQQFQYSICPVRFSIGAILFKRDTWESMGYFAAGSKNGMGADEVQLCSLAMTISRAIVVCENTAVGHFSYGQPIVYKNMKEYFLSNPEKFQIVE
jgi:hypothetical protein